MDFVPYIYWTAMVWLIYDGTALYEYPHSAVGAHEWKLQLYAFPWRSTELPAVFCKLLDKEFHIDGLRMDAISRVIHWRGDPARGVNLNAVGFSR